MDKNLKYFPKNTLTALGVGGIWQLEVLGGGAWLLS